MAKENVGYKLRLGVDEAKKGVKILNKELGNTKLSINDVEKAMKKAFSRDTAFIGFLKSIKAITDGMMKASEAQATYAESLNLLNNAYGEVTNSGRELIDQMSYYYGLDPSNLTKQLGIFRQMSTAMQITSEKADMLSENFTKMAEDVSSMYNIDYSVAAKKLQSGFAGQVRPLRELGADITQQTLQQELYNRGIDEEISNLNRASKSVLIYLTLERQLNNARGDATNTINSMANQMRIFKEQVAIAGRQIGAVFIPILKQILPIANAILMVFNDIMTVILKLIGADVDSIAPDINRASQSAYDFEDALDGAGNSADKTKKKVKELLSLRGFDKLNNITTPKEDKSATSGIGNIGGVDKRLLDQLNEYDNKMQDIENKARKIADEIEKWLFYTDGTEKKLTPLGWAVATIIGLLTAKKVFDVLSTIGKVFKLFTGSEGAKTLGFFGKLKEKAKGAMGTEGGTGLLGLLKTLGLIAVIAAGIIITIKVAEYVWKDLQKLKEEIEGIRKASAEGRKEWLKNEEDINKIIATEQVNRKANLEQLEKANGFWESITGLSKQYLENAIQSVRNSEKDLDKQMELYEQHKLNKEETKKMLDNLVEQYVYNQKIIKKLEEQGVNCEELRRINAEYRDDINKVGEGIGFTNEELDDTILKTSQTHDELKGAFENLEEVNKTELNDKDLLIKVDVDTTKADIASENSKKKWSWLTDLMTSGAIGRATGTGLIPVVATGLWEGGKKVYNWITGKADGGFVDEGEMFIAREAGPEMVGTINGHTAVANNDQIVESISKGVQEAVMIGMSRVNASNTATTKIQVEADEDGILNYITFKQKQNDRQYGV